MSSSDLDHVRALQLVQQRKRECLNYAVLDGLTSAGISLAVAAGLSWSLQKSSDFFRSHFTVGSKAAFIALPTFGVFWWATEKSMARCSLRESRSRSPGGAQYQQQQQQQQQ